MIDALGVWKQTYKDLPKVSNNSWATNIGNWVFDRVVDNFLTGIGTSTNPLLFDKGVFIAQLLTCVQTIDINAGVTQFANAWETAILASSTLRVFPGDYIGSPSPASTWSAVSASIDPSSIAAGKSVIMSLVSAPPTSIEDESIFPDKMREAFLALTGTASGVNSLPIPTALVASMVPFY